MSVPAFFMTWGPIDTKVERARWGYGSYADELWHVWGKHQEFRVYCTSIYSRCPGAGFVLHCIVVGRSTGQIAQGLSPTMEGSAPFYKSNLGATALKRQASKKWSSKYALRHRLNRDNPKSMEEEVESISGSEMQFMKQPMKWVEKWLWSPACEDCP